jgi:hypothetical protein
MSLRISFQEVAGKSNFMPQSGFALSGKEAPHRYENNWGKLAGFGPLLDEKRQGEAH